MADRLLTPSKITAWLDCEHFLTLRHEVEGGTLKVEKSPFGEMAQLLLEKGNEHEAAVLESYRTEGKSVFSVPARAWERNESFAAWVARVGNPMDEGHDVIFQMPFVHEDIRGVADFLVRTVDPESDAITYEPVDAKLARKEAKPGHVLQLCFYAEAVHALTGVWPEHVHIVLGSGTVEPVRVDDVLPYWRRLRAQLVDVMNDELPEATVPEPCDHCKFCEFELVCEAEWRAADSLVHVAGVHRPYRHTLNADGVTTIAGLATVDRPVEGLDDDRHVRFVRQARLQIQARATPDDPPPFELLDTPVLEPVIDELVAATDAVGFPAMPAPDEGDIFLDFEGHPFWRADIGLFFLFGWIERDQATGEWTFEELWAHDPVEEAAATKRLVDYLADRRERFPGMHVYHYNHTERTSLMRLAFEHGVAELELERLIETGMFVDLYPIVTSSLQAGTESYGLKKMERLAGYERGHDIERGAGAVVEYERWMADHEDDHLTKIAAYNEDDVRATWALRDWLVDQRPVGMPWRAAELVAYVDDPERDKQIEELHAFGPNTDEHLMGDLLGYWRREGSAAYMKAALLARAGAADQRESPNAIADLTPIGSTEQFHATSGERLDVGGRLFSFPPQEVGHDLLLEKSVLYSVDESRTCFATIEDVDVQALRLTIVWNDKCAEAGVLPTSLAYHKTVSPKPKPKALGVLAGRLLAGVSTGVGLSLLRRDPPAFTSGHGPAGGRFDGSLEHILGWVTHLDGTCVPVQGPPGTGKTYNGAHVIHALVKAKMTVGVTAMSHHAIDNLMSEVVKRFSAFGELDLLVAIKHGGRKNADHELDQFTYRKANKVQKRDAFNVRAGTPWVFAQDDLRDKPVDVLIVDEAGQLGLADTLAASTSAKNLILLGDPQQLAQVSQANHPNGAGASALEHLLDGKHTVAADRGVLLDVTWRMHPDVCEFISDVFYDGKLTSEASCAGQSTAAGTGLRWLHAEHFGRSTESPEEAAIVASTVAGLLGKDWTDEHGVTRPLTVDDFMVVTPYNGQRRCIEAVLDADPTTKGVQVGTVDKFQGREAAVVVFSMATSSKEFMPRDSAFLFSKNRLNVAISRAGCLAYLICTDELLDTRARTVEEMTLISALCSFVERAAKG